MTFPKDRVPYSAIVDRPPLVLPDGGRLIIWVIVNVEEWGIERTMPRTVLTPPMGQPLTPDLPNWAWHEYGMRVGFWRLLDALQRFNVPATLAINGSVCTSYPRVASAALEAGWEFMGHGFIQGSMHHVEDEAETIAQTISAIRDFTGKTPRGWESPGLGETYDTIDHLAAAGVEYVADWVLDDQPVDIATKHGPVLSIPYTVETNDITMMAVQNHPAGEILNRSKDQFDRLYAESADITRIMAISLHPYITGAPHRIGYLESLLAYMADKPGVLMWTAEQIHDWYRNQQPIA
jgi:peptidoglycan/xylan/chitin deacetylase (PgdA/CDA1 family)